MQIEPGWYRTRDGRKVRVLCTDAKGPYPVVGYVEGKDRVAAHEWAADGRWRMEDDPYKYDLMAPLDDDAHEEELYEQMNQEVIRTAQEEQQYSGWRSLAEIWKENDRRPVDVVGKTSLNTHTLVGVHGRWAWVIAREISAVHVHSDSPAWKPAHQEPVSREVWVYLLKTSDGSTVYPIAKMTEDWEKIPLGVSKLARKRVTITEGEWD